MLAVLLALVVAAWLGRNRYVAPFVLDRVAASLKESTGAELRVRRVSGGWLGDLRLEGVVWEDDTGGTPLRRLGAESLAVRYSLGRLLKGDLGGLEAVEGEGIVVELRLGGGARPPEPEDDGPTKPFELPRTLPRISLERVDVQIEDAAGRSIEVERAALVHDPDRATPLTLDAELLTTTLPWRTRSEPLALRAHWNGAAPRIDSLAWGDDVELRAERVELAEVTAGRVAWTGLELDGGGATLASAGSFAPGALDATLDATRLDLAVVGAWIPFEMGGLVDAEVSWKGPPADLATTDAELEATVDGLSFGPRAIGTTELRATLAQGELAIDRATATRGEDVLRVESGRVALDSLFAGELGRFVRGSSASVDARIADLPGLLAALGAPAPPPETPPHSIVLTARHDGEVTRIESGHVETPGGSIDVRSGLVAWGDGRLADARVDLDVAATFDDIGPLTQLLGVEGSGSFEASAELSGSGGDLSGRLSASGAGLAIGDTELGEVDLEGEVAGRVLTITAGALRGPWARAEVAGTVDFGTSTLREVRASIASEELAELIPQLAAAGPLTIEVLADGPFAAPRVEVEASGDGLVAAALPDTEIGSWSLAATLDGRELQDARLRAESSGVRLDAQARIPSLDARPLSIEVSELSLAGAEESIALMRPVTLSVGDGFATEALELDGDVGHLEVDRLRIGPGSSRIVLSAEDFRPRPLVQAYLPDVDPGTTRGTLDLEWSADTLVAAGELEIVELRIGERPPLSLAFTGRIDGTSGVVERFRLDAGSATSISLEAELPLESSGVLRIADGEMRLVGELDATDLTELGRWIPDLPALPVGELRASFDLAGAASAVEGRVEVHATELAFEGDTPLAELDASAVDLTLEAGPSIVVRSLDFDLPETASARFTGTIDAPLDLTALTRGEVDGLLGAALALQGTLTAGDLSFARRLAPSLRRVGGAVEVAVDVEGTAREPHVSGTLDLNGGEIRGQSGPAVEALAIHASFDGQEIEIERVDGELGAGPFEGSGRMSLAEDGELSFRLTGSDLSIAQSADLRVRANAELTAEGRLDALRVSGRLGLTEGRWSRDIDLLAPPSSRPRAQTTPVTLFSFEDGPLATMELDVKIETDHPFRLVNNVIRGSVRPDLALQGTGRNPVLVGTIYVDDTRVALPASRLTVEAGTVRFTREDPLVPQLDLQLTARTRGYDVTLGVSGPSTDPELDLASSPPLPSDDILLLLVTGQRPEEDWRGGQAAQTVAVFLGKDALSRWLGGDSDEETLLDRVEWTTGADVTQAGGETAELSIRLSGSARGRGRTVYLRAERDVFDRYNAGVRLVFRLE